VTLNRHDDKAYSEYVRKVFRKLFHEEPRVYIRESVVNIVLSRSRLVDFCTSIGLKIGDKVRQSVDIPSWVKRRAVYRIACVRGLMDTDGCIYNECHSIRNKRYCYPRLSFVNHSIPLRRSVFAILSALGFSPTMRNNRSVHLESRDDIMQYFNIIGTSNPKHRMRFQNVLGEVG